MFTSRVHPGETNASWMIQGLMDTLLNPANEKEEELQNKFVIAMDNYFTLPKIIKKLRDEKIDVVGTSRFKQNWPPKELKAVDDKIALFNSFYWMVDDFGTLVGRWIDNGIVFLVLTIHRVNKSVKRVRRKPQKTPRNARHVDNI